MHRRHRLAAIVTLALVVTLPLVASAQDVRRVPDVLRTGIGASPAVSRTMERAGAADVSSVVHLARTCGTPEVLPSELESVRNALRRFGQEHASRAVGGTVRIAFHVIT